MKIASVKINGMARPMGYAFSNVTVSWKVIDTTSVRQKESTVKIALDFEMKEIVSTCTGVLACAGVSMDISLTPRTTYYVQVSVTGEEGDNADSEIVSFDTGKMEEPWQAKWIGVPENCSYHPVFEKSFLSNSDVKRARLYITGVGLYEASINGQKVGDDFLAPFFNDYNCAIQSQTYDVTDMIKHENKLEILLGNGWYKGRLGYDGGVGLYGKQFATIAELHIEYKNGTSCVVLTDESFTASAGDITYSDIYDGEGWDRMLYLNERPSCPVELVEMSDKKLVDRYSMPLHVMEVLPVREVIHTPAGESVLDFGQNFSGYVAFHVKGFAPGTKITLEHGELLQKGNFYHDNYRLAKTCITYVADGRDEWFRPHFTYMGFRYVKVSGWPKEIAFSDFVGEAVYSAMQRTGYVSTRHKKVNQLLSNALWGLKSNFLDMPTDCPQRDERLGWTGDAQVFAPTASFFMDTKTFYRKFLWDMRNDQVLRGGAIANYLPNINAAPGGSAVWADAATFIPETVFKAYGDKGLLVESYPLMKDWVDWITRGDAGRPGGPTGLFNFAFTFGDWLAMDGVTSQSMKGGTEDAYVASIYYYASTCKVADAARVLGYDDDVKKYSDLAEQIKNAILAEYFTPNGRLAVDTQTAYILALYFGIWRDKSILVQGLVNRFRKDGNRIKGGFVGAPLTCETLADNGMFDLAMHIFLQEKFPSWLHCVNLGATTIWERWNSVLDDGSISGTGMNSLNHYAYGSVANFVVRNVAGFTMQKPGYSKVKIAPNIDARLGEVALRYNSASGEYVTNWQVCKDGKLAIHIEIPFDCEAVVCLPESDEKKLTAGVYDFLLKTKRDYRKIYSMESTLDDMTGDTRAMDILKDYLPVAFNMACSDNLENLSMTLNDLRNQRWFGCRPDQVDSAAAKLLELNAMIE